MDWTAADRIERFLAEHPGVPLTVAVGYSSVAGLAWLARRTGNREVRLLIGDCRSKYFLNAKAEDRHEAIAFLERSDVEVQNWYKRHGGASEAHLKVWIADDFPRPAVLSGSANLTNKGLYHNHEMVTEIADAEVDGVIERVEALFAKSWPVKKRLLQYVTPTGGGPSAHPSQPRPTGAAGDAGSVIWGHARSFPVGTHRPAASQPMVTGSSSRGGCARFAKGCGSVALVIGLLAVLIGALSRGCGSGPHTPKSVLKKPRGAPTTTPTPTPDTVAEATTVVVSAVTTTVPEDEPVVLLPLVVAYAEAISGFLGRVDDLVREINSINQMWDARDEESDIYSDTETALVAVAEQTRAFADAVRYQRVPIPLRGWHGEPGGPLRLAARLAELANAVLDGLRAPAPNDGSERRDALQAFNEVAADFIASVERVLTNIEANTQPDGILTVSGQTTTTRPRPAVELIDEAVAYVDGLSRFKESLDEILAEANAVNEAWDNRAQTGVTYLETEHRLEEIAERAYEFYQQVDDQPVPKPVRGLGEGPKRAAPRIADMAREVLAGLRIPAPNTGFERLTALDDLNAAAEAFHASIDHVVYEVYAKAHTSGLAAEV